MNQTNNRIREEWRKKFHNLVGGTIVNKGKLLDTWSPSFTLEEMEDFIAELLKSQRDEERLRSAKIVEELMEDSEHWQPIASRIMDRVIIGKEDLYLIKNN